MTTRLNALADRTSGTDSFGLTNYDNLQADIDYLVVAGADIAALAAGNTATIAARFHKVTVASGNIDSIVDPLGVAKGQPVQLLFANAQTVRNNGGGVGNIRTASGSDTVYPPNTVGQFVYDGANYQEVRALGAGTPIDYAQITTTYATTAAAFSAAITGASVAYAGGKILIETFFPEAFVGGTTAACRLGLFKDGVEIAEILPANSAGAGGLDLRNVFWRGFDTPTAGLHVYSVQGQSDGANTTHITCGAGGAGVLSPAYLRTVTAA